MDRRGCQSASVKAKSANGSIGFSLLLSVLLLGGCVHAPLNQPLAKYDPKGGYRYTPPPPEAPASDVTVLLFFSGGGKRAAALAYGVLRELASTPSGPGGGSRRLLDDVEIISSVSGGSFTAAYYALHHDGIFSSYEERFLKRSVNGALIGRTVNPVRWPSLASPYYGRSDLAADYYDDKVFEHATYADLLRAGGRPLLLINATDMANGEQFAFSQIRFDLIGADLASFPLARAVAASSATPLLLTPLTLQNHAGSAGPVQSAFLSDPAMNSAQSAWAQEIRRVIRSYTDAQERPFIHLVDGGLSDNLGVRSIMDAALLNGGLAGLADRIGMPLRKRLVVVVVNAATRCGTEWGKKEEVPGIFRSIDQLGDNIGQQVNRHTLESFRHILDAWRSGAQAEAIGYGPAAQPDYYLVTVTFDQLTDRAEQEFFQNLPTTLTLPDEAVDRLTAVGGSLLRRSPEFRRFLEDLGEADQIQKN